MESNSYRDLRTRTRNHLFLFFMGISDNKLHVLYQLECDDDIIYIGSITNFDRRLTEHLSGKGSWITKRYRVIDWKVLQDGIQGRINALNAENATVLELRKAGLNAYGGVHTPFYRYKRD